MENMKSAVAKQPSVIESELDILRNRVVTVNSLTRSIESKMWMPRPEDKGEAAQPGNTVYAQISDISQELSIAIAGLELINTCLAEQLGDLKLEN